MNKKDETKETERKGRNITLTVHDGVIGGHSKYGPAKMNAPLQSIIDNIMKKVFFTQYKIKDSNTEEK